MGLHTTESATSSARARQKVFLELISLAGPFVTAAYLCCTVVAAWSWHVGAALGAAVASALTGYWLWHRSVYPPTIGFPPRDEADLKQGTEDDDGTWDWFTLVLLAVSIIIVVVVGVTVRFAAPLVFITLFAALHDDAQLVDVLAVCGLTLGVAFILEFVVIHPLARLWDLDLDEEPRRLDDFCPAPEDR